METVLFLVLAVVGFFVLMQVFMRIMSLTKKGKSITGVQGELGNKIKSGSKLLVYFYSPGCGACRPMTPVIDQMKKEMNNVFKIDVTQKPDIARIFSVMGTPATIVVENEKISQYILGAKPESFLRKLTE